MGANRIHLWVKRKIPPEMMVAPRVWYRKSKMIRKVKRQDLIFAQGKDKRWSLVIKPPANGRMSAIKLKGGC